MPATQTPTEASSTAPSPVLYLKRREEHRIRSGHPWVFSNEVDVGRSPLSDLEPGQTVQVRTAGDRVLGLAYVNPRALICARLVARSPGVRWDRETIQARIKRAGALRARRYREPYYRLVYGECDWLPGLVVDRYGDILVVQLGTAGIERVREDVVAALEHELEPAAIVLRNDIASREQEGLGGEIEIVRGSLGRRTLLHEHRARFEVDPVGGQKTGWYFDQSDNRARVRRYARDARVLDVFSYTGAWGIHAALAGAREVLCVDSSNPALELARDNARLNDVQAIVQTQRADAFEGMKALHAEGRRFDLVVIDPPALIRRRRDLASGQEAYRRVNRLAMRLLEPDGLLVSASCSSHLKAEQLQEIIRATATRLERDVQILERGGASPDHPVLPGMPESEYLKTFFVRVCR